MPGLPIPRAACLALALVAAPVGAEDGPSCRLCLAAEPARDDEPLSIEIDAGIEFSRLARSGRGEGVASLDPQSGTKRVEDGLVDLGGFAVTGRARVSGTPLRTVRIVLPHSVTMRSPDGAAAELTDLATDLPGAAALDANGRLEFAFGARLRVAGSGSGAFRGRVPITVEYD